jgi:hypothetical protein
MWAILGFTVAFVAAEAVAAMFLQFWREPFAGMSLLVWAIFVAAGAFTCLMVVVNVKQIRCRRTYGDSTMTVTHYPDAASNRFCARVVTGAAAADQREVTVCLCEKKMMGDGAGYEVWSRKLELDPRQVVVDRGQALIPMEFDLSGVPEPPGDTPSVKTVWTVDVRATGLWPEYHAAFMLTPTGSPFVRFGGG